MTTSVGELYQLLENDPRFIPAWWSDAPVWVLMPDGGRVPCVVRTDATGLVVVPEEEVKEP